MSDSGIIILGQKPLSEQHGDTVEVCKAFSFKMNLSHYGGNPYESCDIFSSRKMTCAYEARHMVAEALFDECVQDVRGDVRRIADEIQRKKQASLERRTA